MEPEDHAQLANVLYDRIWLRMALGLVPLASAIRAERPEAIAVIKRVLADIQEDVESVLRDYDIRRLEE